MALVTQKLYDLLISKNSSKNSEDITVNAQEEVAKNFSLNVSNGALTKLAEKIISPNLTLPWILSSLGATAGIIGALIPIKNVGSLLPQLFVSGKIRSYAIHKNFWVFSALVQALCWLSAGLLILLYSSSYLIIVMLILLAIFSIASGVASVAFKDVTAKTIPKNIRGQMLSYRATFGGVLGLIAGVILVFQISVEDNLDIYGYMFLLASLLWFLASFIFYMIAEESGVKENARNIFEESKAGMKLIKTDSNFRKFLFTRALLMAIPLLQPFYVLVAKSLSNPKWNMLGYLIIINGLAVVLSSPFWGKIADQSSTRLMRIASFIAIGGGIYALLFSFTSDLNLGFYAFLPVFFINGIAYNGARLSRKTYLIDYAPEHNRATYVSVANTFIGLFTLVAASFGLIAEIFGLPIQILFFLSLLVLSILISFKLKTVTA